MKAKDIVLTVLFLALLLWFISSWVEVMMFSGTGIEHTYCPANIFVLIVEMAK